jgi:hypothetical protein
MTMTRKTISPLVLCYLLTGFLAIHLLGERYADRMMHILEVAPSPDLYANDYGFQYAAFWYTQGVGWSLLLGFSALVFGKFLRWLGGSNT